MSARKPTASARSLRPDPRFNDLVLSKFINCIMVRGQKASAQRIIYDALDVIAGRLAKETDPNAPKEPLACFIMAIENVKPYVEVRSKRIGGANYQVPVQVNKKRAQALAFRWIIDGARSDKGRPMHMRLADELYNAAKKEGKAMAVRDQTHRMAEANKAFAHFA
ncbi:MAG: 30S ribosomal protein S7 [Phycisphaerales bacterium]|jgi:small subunit ribosomal protein S7|nr:30S ribosomal protein S7 [Phycisphaeraceae bacterium]